MIKQFLLATALILVFSHHGHANGDDGYTIKFKINGLKDTICLVANYYGNGTYVTDTLPVDGKGVAIFKAPADQPRGLYILVISDKNYFDFVLNNDKKFTMETDRANPVGSMKIIGSLDNEEFYEYMRYNQEKFGEIQQLQKRLKNSEAIEDSVIAINKQIAEMNDALIDYKLTIAKNRPFSFLAMLINAMKEPVITEIPTLPNGRKDSTYAYRYFKEHYWDDMVLADNRLIRTPVFHNKLKKYFDQVVVQNPDSIFKEAVILIEKARPDPEMFKYIVWFMTYHYENSEIMGFDKVFIDIVDRYYVTGEAIWITGAVLENILKKASRIRPLLLGNQAPNMVMMDTTEQLVSLYNTKAFITILLFWDPDCGHCEKEIPHLKEFYEKYKEKYELEIFAVCSDTSMAKMKEHIIKKKMNWVNVNGPRSLTGDYHDLYDIQTTPVIYVLDMDKRILAKRLQSDQVEKFVNNYVRRELGADMLDKLD
ncbi:thioredoxin-like domain-containing protein [Bacteroidota bacterium]